MFVRPSQGLIWAVETKMDVEDQDYPEDLDWEGLDFVLQTIMFKCCQKIYIIFKE